MVRQPLPVPYMLSVSTEDAAPFPPDGPNLSGISAAPTAAVERRMGQSCRHQLFPVHFIFLKTMGKAKNDPGNGVIQVRSWLSHIMAHLLWRISFWRPRRCQRAPPVRRPTYVGTYEISKNTKRKMRRRRVSCSTGTR